VISWIKVLIDCRGGESDSVEVWLDTFPRLPIDDAVALESVRLGQRHGLKIPDAIILATARCADLNLATRNSRDFRLTLGGAGGPARGSARGSQVSSARSAGISSQPSREPFR
jgi:hypothetical protein